MSAEGLSSRPLFGTSAEIRKQSAAIVRPPPRLKISEWADREAWIPGEGNAEPGKFRLSRMPHQAQMLDDLQEPEVREVFWMLASQAGGKTLSLILICLYVICVLRRSIIVVRDTKDRAKEWVRDKFLPTAEATPAMKGLLVPPQKRNSRSTALSMRFAGGVFKVIGAKSAGAFRSTSCGDIYQDEIDAYQVTKEGDPCELADRAAVTFMNAWKLKCSTPTIEGVSRIHAGFLRGDQQYYFLPCKICGGFQWLKTERMKFSFTAEEELAIGHLDPKGREFQEVVNGRQWQIGRFPVFNLPRAIYVCEHCQHGWTDFDRIAAYMSGHRDNPPVVPLRPELLKEPEMPPSSARELRAKWVPTAPFKGIRSRHLNGMYITIGLKRGFETYLHQFAQQFMDATAGGRETLMPWTNMFKCWVYEEPGEKLPWQDIKKRAEDYDPDGQSSNSKIQNSKEDGTLPENNFPAQVVWIAWGGDVHPDRVEILFYGWGEGQEAWCLSHQVFFGDFDMPSMQERVWDYLEKKRFEHPVLGPMTWSAGGMDSGHQTKVKAVYQFCARHRVSNVFSVKGFEELGGAVYERKTERVYGGTRLNLNTDYLKTLIFDRLRNASPGPRFIHFPQERSGQFGDLFYGQLCSEKRVKKKVGSAVVLKWEKHTSATRNEILDMTVYAHGIYEVCRQEEWIARKWKEVREKLQSSNSKIQYESRPTPVDEAKAAVRAAVAMSGTEKKIPGVEREQPQQRRPQRRRIRINSPFRKFGG